MQSSNSKGAVAELEIATAATKLGIPVYKPLSGQSRADLILEVADQLLRVQCKWGRLSTNCDVVIATLRTSRCTPHGHVRRTYSAEEVDVFAIYCGALDRAFLIPASEVAGRQQFHLRLTPCRNGQHACINLADDFTCNGAVAQLARARRWQRRGQGFESPQLHSASSPDAAVTVGAGSCRVQFGSWIERVRSGEDVIVTRRGKPMIRLASVAEVAAPKGIAAGPPGNATAPPGNAAPAPAIPAAAPPPSSPPTAPTG
jgi:prevent-host-death family protein